MFDSCPATLDPGLILTAAEDAKRSLNRAEACILELACLWADANTVLSDHRALPGAERMIALGGDGTPEVAEFAPAEFGAACAMSTYAAKVLIGDALDLRHRHPLLWQRVLDGDVKAYVAARIVRTTRDHSLETALAVDAMIAPYADRKSAGELERICEAELIRLDPTGAQQCAERAEADQGVWSASRPTTAPATSSSAPHRQQRRSSTPGHHARPTSHR